MAEQKLPISSSKLQPTPGCQSACHACACLGGGAQRRIVAAGGRAEDKKRNKSRAGGKGKEGCGEIPGNTPSLAVTEMVHSTEFVEFFWVKGSLTVVAEAGKVKIIFKCQREKNQNKSQQKLQKTSIVPDTELFTSLFKYNNIILI